MAPSRTDDQDFGSYEEPKISYDINVPYKPPSGEYELRTKERTEFPDYLPVWESGLWFDDFPIFEYHDPALRADQSKPHLFSEGVKSTPITPKMGTILTGVKLDNLSQEAKDELALLVSERKVVVCREQSDFLHKGPAFQVEFMEYFGKLSHQPVTGAVKGFPQFHIIHRDGNKEEIANFFKHKTTSTIWHHDVSYERQPPGYIMLGILACPDVGGDTVVADMAEAYNRLSPAFQNMINGMQAVHTSENLIGMARKARGQVRSDPIDSVHPVVRVHPVTGEKALFINMEWPKEYIGLKDEESQVVVKYLLDHIRMGHDFQARVHWEKHSVVIFDGRTTLHTATVDYDNADKARHLFRLAAMTEVPLSVADAERGQN
ncbi:Alpha-ketoglutarate-dependent sulfonate dioxygenase [Lachnellula hyalina]|uniref:Alpha-ketoglutarate-dependent sulfonate dioxygenase n=1 Tax=Lachnellula hyalina TaxID=1316788 RepID=A0A8H8R800_9HELO|nr:Alpha-ketoglutarate-dependent sulfonate dioxygenase [Lachnellula hyalina]TVY29376.1 Alpha-ketoglutarate-dependent sulfonate dioxygenase [Lachnellula hyalina]